MKQTDEIPEGALNGILDPSEFKIEVAPKVRIPILECGYVEKRTLWVWLFLRDTKATCQFCTSKESGYTQHWTKRLVGPIHTLVGR